MADRSTYTTDRDFDYATPRDTTTGERGAGSKGDPLPEDVALFARAQERSSDGARAQIEAPVP